MSANRLTYTYCFTTLLIVYIIGLFVPLMDNDSAHHANIALRMYLTGDYVNLVDNGKDYLDKPHLHFWLASLSYEVFGVNAFAYKLPSFLFTIIGTFSVFKLGKRLYNSETGRLAALIIASAFAYILANNDVRMDALLTASVAISSWQLIAWVQTKKLLYAVGGALGLALAFATKGYIGVVLPAAGVFFYILYRKQYRDFYHWQLLAIIFSFFLFISPVVYCYYLQFDLHPEKIIRGESGRSGVEFILWKQNTERFQGDSFGGFAKNDYSFFFHSFLWAFAPWSIIAFISFFRRIKGFTKRRDEWYSPICFFIMLLLMTFSGFKLPHYLNIMFPAAAVLTASYLFYLFKTNKRIKAIYFLQLIISILIVLTALFLNIWAFPITDWLIWAGALIIISLAIFFFIRVKDQLLQIIIISSQSAAFVFFLMNANFYPKLLPYQGGQELAEKTKGLVNPQEVLYQPYVFASSYVFETEVLRKDFSRSALDTMSTPWIIGDSTVYNLLEKENLTALDTIIQPHYIVSRLTGKFLNPKTREEVMGRYVMVKVR